jgi:GxxExxY protein
MILREDLLYPDLSYKITGCAFKVFNQLGAGHLEKIYQKALAAAFEKDGLKFVQQIPYEIRFDDGKLGYRKLDFLVENKIVVEIKRGSYFSPGDFHQLKNYMVLSGLQLGLLVRFAPDRVYVKRVVNIIPGNKAA